MQGLVLVCGIPYSGKSYFAHRLSQLNHTFKHYELDRIGTKVSKNRDIFFNCLKKINPLLAEHAINGARYEGIKDPQEQINHMMRITAKSGGEEGINIIRRKMHLIYLADLISKNPEEKAVIDGTMPSKRDRTIFYEEFREAFKKINKELDLDKIRKTVVYVDTPLEECIHRFKQGRNDEMKIQKITEEHIRSMYASKELPVEAELPNTGKRYIIKNKKEVPNFLENVVKSF